MEKGDILYTEGKAENQGLPFNLELEVVKVLDFNGNKMVVVVNTLNNDQFILNVTLGRIATGNPNDFYSDCFMLFNKTQNIRII